MLMCAEINRNYFLRPAQFFVVVFALGVAFLGKLASKQLSDFNHLATSVSLAYGELSF